MSKNPFLKFDFDIESVFTVISSELAKVFPRLSITYSENGWGQATGADGYAYFVSCKWPESDDKETDLVDLEITIQHCKTNPLFMADVCWGHPSGYVENEFAEDLVPVTKETTAGLTKFLPDLRRSFEAAIVRGYPGDKNA